MDLEYKYESFQSTLPSSLPAGWNDPPPMPTNTTAQPNNRLAQLRRRPVDPSCQGTNNAYGAVPHAAPYAGHSDPYAAAGAGYPQAQPQHSMHFNQAAPPGNAPQNYSNHYQPSSVPPPSQYGSAPQHVVNNPSAPSNTMTQPSQQPSNPSYATFQNQQQYQQAHQQAHQQPHQQPQVYNVPHGAPQSMPAPVTSQPINSHQTYPSQQPTTGNLVFSPPNTVDDGNRSFAQQFDNFRMPVKAAGDVSLSGPQLIMFLTKASMRLPEVKCEGVQLRLRVLQDMIQQNRISEGCLKKLNFVVDAIDRQLYDDSATYFDQLQQQFPQEIVSWGQGLRLLILELKSIAPRIGSAGPYGRSQ